MYLSTSMKATNLMMTALLAGMQAVAWGAGETPAPVAEAPAAEKPTTPKAEDFSELSRREFSLWLGYESGWFVAQNIPDGQCDAKAFAARVVELMGQPGELKRPEPPSEEFSDKLRFMLAYQSWERGMRAHREGAEFLKRMAAEPGVQSLPCGVLYRVNKPGTGEKYSAEAHGAHPVVHMRYSISSISGCKLADFTDEPVDYVMGDSVCIAGVDALLPHLPAGSSCTMYIPSDLAFGATEINDTNVCATLPANSVLVVDMVVEGFAKNDTQTHEPIAARPFSDWTEPAEKPEPLTDAERKLLGESCATLAALHCREQANELVEGYLVPEAIREGVERAISPDAAPVPPPSMKVMMDCSRARRHQPKNMQGTVDINPETGEIEIFSLEGEKVGNITPGPNGFINVNIEEKEEQGKEE